VYIPKGSLLTKRYHAANRDRALFEHPIGLENASDHIAFGQGIHSFWCDAGAQGHAGRIQRVAVTSG